MNSNSVHFKTFPNHVDQVETEVMGGEVEVIEMPVINNPLLFFL